MAPTPNSPPRLIGSFSCRLRIPRKTVKLDLVAGNHMYLGNGDGTFRSAGAISLLAGSIATAAADVNHDGKLDLLLLTSPEGDRATTSCRYFLEMAPEALRPAS